MVRVRALSDTMRAIVTSGISKHSMIDPHLKANLSKSCSETAITAQLQSGFVSSLLALLKLNLPRLKWLVLEPKPTQW
jgi:hypothetical protein